MDSIFTLSVAFFPIQNSLFSWNLTCQFLLLLLQLEECLSAAPWYSWTWIFPEYFQSFRSLFKVFNPFWADFNFLEHRRKESSSCLWKTVFVKKKRKKTDDKCWQVWAFAHHCLNANVPDSMEISTEVSHQNKSRTAFWPSLLSGRYIL